ncbi:MAG: replication-associated recombination protein A [Bacillota bacterium]|nr:replication-associated recombination protein A [Bacillota bacterium]
MRPKSLSDVVGQKHLLGNNGILKRIIESGIVPNMVFFGPPGIGKTTVADIIAKSAGKTLYKLNGTSASTSDIKAIISGLGTFEAQGGVLVYLDEIQYFNKKQQQSLLEYMENGDITLIASTTENPYFYVYPALLSRSTVFEFMPLDESDIMMVINRGIIEMEHTTGVTFDIEKGVLEHIAFSCGGDVRKSLVAVELLCLAAASKESHTISLEDSKLVTQKSAIKYDKDGDSHYNILSAFQKSIRGSDPDAGLYYLARLVAAGDLPSICRRILVIAAEDIGLAYPQAISIVKACVDSALQLGFPEARIPLAEAVILLATAPKSNSAIIGIDTALSRMQAGNTGDIPAHLKDSHYSGAEKLSHGVGYKYPHNYDNHYVAQQYLPDKLKNTHFYEYGDNKLEQITREYWIKIKDKKG